MKQKLYQVDAFTDKLFSGNPAAICPLGHWLSDDLMQKIAMENNLAETGYYVAEGTDFRIRWFTPTMEVDLCGHATLAAAHVLFNHEKHEGDEIRFHSRSGMLRVLRSHDTLTLDFPADVIEKIELFSGLTDGLDIKPVEAFKGKSDYMFVYENADAISRLKPDFRILSELGARGVIVTARGKSVDFVSRFFAPGAGIDEDSVTGSAHTTLTPYWSRVLGKKELTAIQLSSRQGYLQCRQLGERVEISGKARTYLTGEIEIDDTR